MTRRACLLLSVLFLIVPLSQAARPTYQKGIVTGVERKAHDRVLYYLVNTPVMTEDPYYEILVQVSGTVYVAEYPLRQQDDELPFDWKKGDEVRVMIDKSHIFVQRAAGGSLKMIIARHFPVPKSGNPKQTH